MSQGGRVLALRASHPAPAVLKLGLSISPQVRGEKRGQRAIRAVQLLPGSDFDFSELDHLNDMARESCACMDVWPIVGQNCCEPELLSITAGRTQFRPNPSRLRERPCAAAEHS